MAQLRFGIVGSGWRAQFFARAARALPELFACTGVVTRAAERGAQIEADWHVPTFRSIPELLAGPDRPDLVVVSVPWPVTPEATRELVAAGVPVLAETPPAPDVEGLERLWADVGASGLVQVAEHSPFMPAHQARRAVVDAGLIGTATSVQISSTHLYHAVGLIRHLLDAGREEVVVRAQRFTAPLLEPLARDGWTGETQPRDARTLIATLDLGGGRSGTYDFTDNQWHNPLRTNRIVVRGSHGEIVGDDVTWFAGDRTVLTSTIERRVSGLEQNLDGFDLEHLSLGERVLYRNPFLGSRFADDELAVAHLLAACSSWLHDGGPEPYPLADGCHDHRVALAMEEAADSGRTVTVPTPPWR